MVSCLFIDFFSVLSNVVVPDQDSSKHLFPSGQPLHPLDKDLLVGVILQDLVGVSVRIALLEAPPSDQEKGVTKLDRSHSHKISGQSGQGISVIELQLLYIDPICNNMPVSYTHLTLPTTPYV